MKTSDEELLKKIYYNPAIGLGTARSLFNIVKENDKKIKYSIVKEWVDKQENKQIFYHNKIIHYPAIIGHSDNDYQADLMFLDEFKSKNNGYHIIFTAIELTSRKAYAYKLKYKTNESIDDAFTMFMSAVKNVTNLTTDNGSEFISALFKKEVKKHNITHYLCDAGDKEKMGKIERFNRTLRDKITKYQKTFKTLRWVDVLDDLIKNYNNSVHSSTGYKPNNVTHVMADKIRNKERENSQLAYDLINTFKAGDKVRLLKKKEIFEKGLPTYSRGIYTVDKIDKLALIVKNSAGNVLERRIKPYQVLRVKSVDKAPEIEAPVQSASLNKREVRRDRNLKRDFDNVEDGKVIIDNRLTVAKAKRVDKNILEVGSRVQAWFKDGDEKKLFAGSIIKVNLKTFTVLFDDGDKRYMKKEELEKIPNI